MRFRPAAYIGRFAVFDPTSSEPRALAESDCTTTET